ncbi:MAG: SufS family cysteine desulfurase [Candidatus Kapaibacterium sp.]
MDKSAIVDRAAKKINIDKIRSDFPVLSRKIRGNSLVYLDNAATTQKPRQVIDKINRYYSEINSNIHRGVHTLSQQATNEYEAARNIIKEFINADNEKEIVFTRGATESINLVASSYGRKYLKPGDEVLITYMEHHSNIVPWQILAEQTGVKLRVVPINDDGEIIMDEFRNMLSDKTKLVSVVHVSNSLGTINPIEEIIELAHKAGAHVLIDAAQSVQHLPVDVKKLGCDFLALSGHKIYGPTGIGVLYGRQELLHAMPPYQGGGDMISTVTFEKTLYNDLPYKFEAGTPNIAGAIGLGEAIKFINKIGINNIYEYEHALLDYATQKLSEIDELTIIGTASKKSSAISFVLDNVHPHDVGTLADTDGVAIRTGHHCTEPVMKRFGVPATSRASFSFYNTRDDVDQLAETIKNIIVMFR